MRVKRSTSVIAFLMVFCLILGAMPTDFATATASKYQHALEDIIGESTPAEEPAPVGAEQQLTVNVSNYTFYVKRGDVFYTFDQIEALGGLENGDYLQINFDWLIDNLDQDKVNGDVDYDVDLELHGIELNQFSNIPFHDSNRDQAGTFSIVEKDGKTVMSIHLFESYLRGGSDKKGTGEISGNINVKNDDNKDSVDTEIGIGKTVFNKKINCKQEEGDVSVDKSSGTPVGPASDGTYTVPFAVTITASKYDALLTDLIDNLGNAYTGGLNNIKCGDSTYGTFDEMKAALFNHTDEDGEIGMKLAANSTITITYDAVVGSDYFEQNGGKSLNNSFKAEYKTNLKNKKEKWDYETPAIPKPSVTKSGSFNADKTAVTWTVTINPKPFEWSDVTGPFQDTYTESTGYSKTVSFDKSQFTGPDANGNYTYSYTVDISQDALDFAHKAELKNVVSDVSIKGHKYSGGASLYTDGNPNGYVVKDVDSSAAASDGILKWTTRIKIPDGSTQVSFEDSLDLSMGQQAFFKKVGDVFTVSIGGVPAMQFTCTYIDAYNCYSSSKILLTDMIDSCYTDNRGKFIFYFKPDYINSVPKDDDIVITYNSFITETSSAGKTYRNVSKLNYVYNGIRSTGTDDAKWYDDDPSLSVTYKNSINNDDGSFIYSLATDLKEANLKVGDVITYKEELPAGMKMDNGTGIISAYVGKFATGYVIKNLGVYGVENWNNHIEITDSVSASHTDGSNDYVYSVTVTQAMLDVINSSTSCVGLIINVGAHIENVAEITEDTSYTNTVSASKESGGDTISLGKAGKTDTFKVYDIISKSCDFQYENDIIEFIIDINPYATDFDPESDWLDGKDKMGDGLSFKSDSLKVYEVGTGGTETELAKGSGYKYTFDALNNTLKFELPDAKHIKIKYSAYYILGKNEAIDPVASANVFYLLGKSKSTEDIMKSIDLSGKAKLVPYSITSDITLYKFAEDENGNRFGLNGASFSLYEADYSNGKLSLGSKVMDRQLSKDESQWKIENLYLDKLYALVENTSPTGYEKDKEIYYFILPGGSWNSLSSTYASIIGTKLHVHRAGSGDPNAVNYLLYQNKPGEDGKLVITKTITGVKAADLGAAADTVSFVVKNNDTGVELTYKLSDFKYDSTAKKYTLELQEKGSYTVTETVSNIEGYKGVTTTYRVNSGAEKTGKSANVTVSAGDTATVDFNNEYETVKSRLVLTKTVAGITDAAELAKVVDVVKFRVYNAEINYDKTFTLKSDGFTKNGYNYTKTIEVPIGKYTIEETAFSIDGYNTTVTYTYNSVTKEGIKVSASVVEGNTTNVKFTNTYYNQKASIILKKNITGILDADMADALGVIEFTIRDSNGNVVGTYALDSDFTKTGSQYVSSEIIVLPGTYTVEETAYDVTGYKTKSVKYSVLAGPSGTGSSVTFDVEDEGEEEVTFTNDYEQATGKLVITKTIAGSVPEDEAKAAISFKVTDNKTNTSTTYSLNDFTKSGTKYVLELEKTVGGYTVEETAADISGYITKSVKYKVNSEAEKEGSKASVTVDMDETDTVAFTNEYEKAKGKLVLSKTIAGITDAADLAAATGVIEFKIKDSGNNVVGTYKLDGFTQNGDTFTKEIELEIGNYTVEETQYALEGYNVVIEHTYKAVVSEGKSVAVSVEEGRDTAVAFTDTYSEKKGFIVLEKIITGIAAADEDKALEAITFTITDESDNLVGTYVLKNDFTKSGAKYSTGEISVKPGKYKITETVSKVPGYATKSVTYSVAGGVSGTGNSVSVNVIEDEAEIVDFTDTYEKSKGNLIITKTLTGPVTNAEAKAALKFKVTNNQTGTSATYSLNDFIYSSGVYKLELEREVGGYTVEETVSDITGYITKKVSYTIDSGAGVTGKSATVTLAEEDNTKVVAFNNVYETGKLVITKTVTGPVTSDQVKAAIKFKVTDADSNSREYSLDEFTYSGGVYTLKLDYKLGGYTVEESASDINGFVTKKVTYKVNGGTAVSGKSASVTISEANPTGKVDFTDEYEEATGKIVIAKTITGPVTKDEAKVLRFKVTNNTTGLSTVYGLSDFTLTGGVYKLTLDAAIGGYTVEETVSDIEGYTTRSVRYQVNGGAAVSGKSAVVTIAGMGDTGTVEFEDEYEPIPCDIKITKTIASLLDSTALATVVSNLYFEVTDDATMVTQTYRLATDFTKNSEEVYELTLTKPAGTYTITEKSYLIDDYHVTASYRIDSAGGKLGDSATLTLVNGQNVNVDFKNNYLINPILEITKTMTGINPADAALAEDSIVFTVTNVAANTVFARYKLSEMPKNADGSHTIKLKVEPGVEYCVEETAYTVDGYAYKTTKYKLNSAGAVTGRKVNVTVPANMHYVVAFNNEYGDLGKLLITKTVNGPVDKVTYEDTISFDVKNNTTNATVNYKLTDFTYNVAKGRYELELPCVAGGYTVTEKAMNIAGYTNKVTYSVDSGTTVTGTSTVATVRDGATTKLDFTNTYSADTGKLIITKTVSSIVPKDTAEANIRFKVVSISDPSDSAEYKLSDFTYNAATKKWTLELDKKIGSYRVTETAYDIDGYVTRSVQYNVNGLKGDGTKGGTTLIVTKNASIQADFTDVYDYERGKIVITKTIDGPVTKDIAEQNLVFVVQSVEDASDKTTYTLRDFVYDDAAKKWTLPINDKKTGKYTVTETVYDIAGFVTKSVKYTVDGVDGDGTKGPAEVVVLKDSTGRADFADVYDYEYGNLVITKTIAGNVDKVLAENTLKFTVTNNATDEVKEYKLSDFVYDAAGGTWKLTLNNIPAGDYTVRETVADIRGFVTKSVKYQVKGEAKTEGTSAVTSITKGKTVNVDFEDTYEPEQGKFVITKTIEGINDSDITAVLANIQFTVKNNTTGEERIYNLKDDFTFDSVNKIYKKEFTGNVGNYTVTETAIDVGGYIMKNVTYQIDSNAKVENKSADISVTKDDITEVKYVNSYVKSGGTLKLSKMIIGDVNRKDTEACVIFDVTNKETGETNSYTLADNFVYDPQTGRYVMELPLVSGGYTVTEKTKTVKGYLLKKVTYNLDAGGELEGANVDIDVSGGRIVDLYFRNTYEPDKELKGKIVITKQIKDIDRKAAEGFVEFVVTNLTTGVQEAYLLSRDFTYDETSKRYILVLEKPVGQYRITEVLYDIDGHPVKTVTYNINSSEEISVREATVTVEKDKEVWVNYTNTYTTDPDDPDEPDEPDKPDDPDKPVKTGDALYEQMKWSIVMMVSSAMVMFIFRRREENEEFE